MPPVNTTGAQKSDADHALFRKAQTLHQRGVLHEAETLYRNLLQKFPADFDVLYALGLIQGQSGRFACAIDFLARALAADSNNAAAHCIYGNCLKGLGRATEALTSYDRALALRPDDADTLNNRGATLRDLGQLEAALDSFTRALAVNADHGAALGNRGLTLRDLKRHEDALACYDRILALQPDNIDALACRAGLLVELGRPADALQTLERVLQLTPENPAAHSNYGSILNACGRLQEALASYDRALALAPQNVDLLCKRGTVLHQLKRHDAALASFDRALEQQPQCVQVLVHRSAALRELRQFRNALECIDQALALEPGLAVAHFIRGTALTDMKQFDQALASHTRALSIQPGDVEALIGQGMALRGLSRNEEALRAFDQALEIEAGHVNSHLARGLALENLKRYEEALGSVDRALALQPDNADAHHNRGALLVKLRRPQDALASYGNALTANPNHLASLSDRGDTLMYTRRSEAAASDFARLATLDPDYPYVHGNLLHAKLSCCDWQGLDALAATIARDAQLGKKAAEPFNCVGFIKSPALLRRSAEIYVADQFPKPAENCFPRTIVSADKIRLGYVAGEFRHHATSILMVELFERHDRNRFEVYAFDNGWDDGSPLRRRLHQAFAEIVDISRLGDIDAAQKVRGKGIDILIDLNGHVGRRRTGLFALRAAPVQVNWLGFPGTMGAGFMDYIIGDAVLTPGAHAQFYSEAIVHLPGSYQINDSKRVIAEHTPTRTESGLPESGFVFCCFNDNFKITPEVFDVWMRLLKQVKHSVLWLFESNAVAARNLRAEAASRGIAENRLVFAKRIDLPDHLARHRLADLFLDTLPCNAHTTASDALWAGLPLLTCLGDTFAGRVAGSLLHALGQPELVTSNLADYEALALKLATTPSLLSDLRTRLAQNRSTHALFDAECFRRHIESAFSTMHQRRLRGEPVESFSVAP